eukprot:m.81198 g.81198  ORF g.81198 m.81198 type:complete len:481 (-) comp13357_c0_seq1:75-1517(-)
MGLLQADEIGSSTLFGDGPSRQLQRTISLPSGVAFIVGAIIGSGIFASPGAVLLYSGSVGASLLAWFVAGLIAITGSAAYAELGTMLPDSGGEYTYILEAFGQLPAFLFVWTSGLITRPGSLAIISLVCGEYLVMPFFSDPTSPDATLLAKAAAMIVVVIISLVGAFSVDGAVRLQDIFTVLKLAALAIVCIVGLVFFIRDVGDPSSPAATNFAHAFSGTSRDAGRLGMSVIASLWSYDGWNNLNFVTEELKNPDRNLPRAIFIGVPLVMVTYVLAAASYYAVLPVSAIVSFSQGKVIDGFATQFGKATMGLAGRIILPLCIAASTFGAANGTGFTGARLVYAAARDGHFPAWLATLRPGPKPTPATASCFQGLLAVLMLLPGNFETLVNYFSACAWLFYFIAVASLLRLRVTQPNTARPFRVWTWVPVLFCMVSLTLFLAILVIEPVESVIAMAFVLSGVPVYYLKARCGFAAQPRLAP